MKSFSKVAFIIFVVIMNVFIGIEVCSSAQVSPLTSKAVAAFYERGKFDPHQISENDLYESVKTAYEQESDPDKLQTLAERLLRLKWWRLWEANFEMSPETTIISDPLKRYFRPSGNWQWTKPISNPANRAASPERSHYSEPAHGTARHHVKGNFPYILPANGILLQEVYFPEDTPPEKILLRIETGFLANSHSQPPEFVRVRWTKTPESHPATENRPTNFWAGTFSATGKGRGKWRLLAVNLVDLGLCGRNRSIHGIEFTVFKGQAWFGRTIIRRPQVEIRGTRNYHLFSEGEELAFELWVHNFLETRQQYTLDLSISNYQGSELRHLAYTFNIPGKTSQHKKLTINPGKSHYLVLEYTLSQAGEPVWHGYSSAAIIVPNTTGRKPSTKFGMMYWDQPGKDMVELYEKLGVKLIVIFPEIDRLHLFDNGKFEVMPMFWALPERSPQEGVRLQQQLPPYIKANQRFFSNFWETDLRVPAKVFAPNMRKFSQIIKQAEPAALTGIGGLAWFNVAYLSQLLRLMGDAPSFFDFLAIMLYNTPSPPEYSGIIEETEALTALLERYEKTGIELWNVEWAYFDNLNLNSGSWLNTGVSREYIAPYTIRHHLLGFASGIKRMVPGTIIYGGRLPLAKNYGHSMTLGRNSILRYDLTPLPTAVAYSVMTRMLEGKEYMGSVEQHPNVFCQVYRAVDESYRALASTRTVVVLWSIFGNEDIALTMIHDSNEPERKVTVVNMIGETREQMTANGELHLSITPEPTYILLDETLPDLADPQKMTFAEPFLSPKSKHIELVPGKETTVKLTYRLFNSGNHAVQGRLRLVHPNWLTVAGKEIVYHSKIGQQFASEILSGSSAPAASTDTTITDEIWLGREHVVDVTYELRFPEKIVRTTYYEQLALTQQWGFQIGAEFLSDQHVLARALTPVRMLSPLQLRLCPVLSTKHDINAPKVRVRLENYSPIHREGQLRMKAPGGLDIRPERSSFSIPPGQAQVYDFTVKGLGGSSKNYVRECVDTQLKRHAEHVVIPQKQPERLDHYRRNAGYLVSFGVGEGYVIEALVSDQTGYEIRQSRGFAFRPAVKAKHPIVIDGKLEDWADAVPLFIHPAERLSGLTFAARDYGEKMQWSGLDDFSAAWQMMWDKSFLYLAVKIFDDQVIPQHYLGRFWNGDSLSFQIDPRPDLTDASIQPEPRDLRTVHTFNVGLSRDGAHMYRKYPTEERWPGNVKTANVAIRQKSEGLIYELAIAWEELAPLRPHNGGWMGFSLVFYEDDGDGRETRCNWFGGTGGNGLAREPRLMGDVHFVE